MDQRSCHLIMMKTMTAMIYDTAKMANAKPRRRLRVSIPCGGSIICSLISVHDPTPSPARAPEGRSKTQKKAGAEQKSRDEVARSGEADQCRQKTHDQQRGTVDENLAIGAVTIRFDHRQKLNSGLREIFTIKISDGQRMRNLPEKHDRKQHPRVDRQLAARGNPADHGRQGARNRADWHTKRTGALHRRIDQEITQGNGGRDNSAQ